MFLQVETTKQDLVDAMLQEMDRDYNGVKNIIKQIDLGIADYEFTLYFAKWFVKQLKEEHKAVGEEFDINELLK
jgi:hypothetical protein